MGYDFCLEDRDARVLPSRAGGLLELEIEDGRVRAALEPGDRSGEWTLCVDGRRERLFLASANDVHFVHWRGRTHRVEARNALERARAEAGRSAGVDVIHAPMPGVVVSLAVAAGDVVDTGALLLTIESMKLQTAITAGHPARVVELCVAAGETFDQGRALVRLAPSDGADSGGGSASGRREKVVPGQARRKKRA